MKDLFACRTESYKWILAVVQVQNGFADLFTHFSLFKMSKGLHGLNN